MIALTVSLGRWQMHRAEEKEARQALLQSRTSEPAVRLTGQVPSAEPLVFRRVHAEGDWIAGRQIYVDNQVHQGRAGFTVITPLHLRGSGAAVLVNRGWEPRGAEYPRAPQAPVPPGPATVEGIATTPPARFIELSGETITGDVWQNLSIERYRAATGLDVLPIVVLADRPGPGLVAADDRPDAGMGLGAEKHRDYELTWVSLAATTFVLWVGLNMRRAR